MRLVLKQGILAFAAESADELEALDAWQAAHRGHVFVLEASSDRGGSFHDLGPREDACRVPINITFERKDERLRLISNLAHTPFVLDGRSYASVEGFWQSLRFDEGEARDAAAQLWGAEAKRRGMDAPDHDHVFHAGRAYPCGSSDHRALMYRACRAKFEAHAAAREALLSTGDRPLAHRVRRDSQTIPGVVLADFWMRIRRELRNAPQA